jgi:hypothetical protein
MGHPESDAITSTSRPSDHRVEIRRAGWIAWYDHREDGLEQGFTIEHPPSGQAHDSIVIDLPIETSLVPRLVSDSSAVRFLDASGQPALSYDDSTEVKLTPGSPWCSSITESVILGQSLVPSGIPYLGLAIGLVGQFPPKEAGH